MPNMSSPCTAQNLSVSLFNNAGTAVSPGTSGGTHFTRTFAIRANGATSVISCTILDPATTCTSAGTGTLNASDQVAIEASYFDNNVAAETAANALFGWECQKQ